MRRRVHDYSGLAAAGRGTLDDTGRRGFGGLSVRARARLAVFNHGAGATRANRVCSIVGATDGSGPAMRGLGRGGWRHDWRGTATRRSETHAPGNVFDQFASMGALAQLLDTHGLAVLLVHDGKVLSIHAVDILGDEDGARLATVTEGIAGGIEGEGAVSAVADVALKVVDHQLLVIVEVAHHDGRLDNLDSAGHIVGAADSEEATGKTATRRIAWIGARRGKRIRDGAIGRHRDGLLEDHARDGGLTVDV